MRRITLWFRKPSPSRCMAPTVVDEDMVMRGPWNLPWEGLLRLGCVTTTSNGDDEIDRVAGICRRARNAHLIQARGQGIFLRHTPKMTVCTEAGQSVQRVLLVPWSAGWKLSYALRDELLMACCSRLGKQGIRVFLGLKRKGELEKLAYR